VVELAHLPLQFSPAEGDNVCNSKIRVSGSLDKQSGSRGRYGGTHERTGAGVRNLKVPLAANTAIQN
jgi:hypothetical protein